MKSKITAMVLITSGVILLSMVQTGCYLFTPVSEGEATIKIEPRLVTVGEGQQIVASIEVTPAQMQEVLNVEYVVSKPENLEIEAGKYNAIITTYAKGVTKITANASNGSTAEMLVNIQPKDSTSGTVYIAGRTRYIDLGLGSTAMVSASLVGASEQEAEQMIWRTLDERIAKVKGAGTQVLIEAVSTGETKIQIAHPLAERNYEIDLSVRGDTTQLELSEVLVNMKVGEEKSIKGIIRNAPPNSDLTDITWKLIHPDEEQPIGSISGTLNQIMIKAIRPGVQKVMATTGSGARAYSDIVVRDKEGLEISDSSLIMQPNESSEITYAVSPASDTITITCTNSAIVQYTHVPEMKKIIIKSKDVGSAQIGIATSSGIKGTVYIASAWNKYLRPTTTVSQNAPGTVKYIPYTVAPPDTIVSAQSSNLNAALVEVDNVNKQIIITHRNEGSAVIKLSTQYGSTTNINIDTFAVQWGCDVEFVNIKNPVWVLQPPSSYPGVMHGFDGNKIWIGDSGIGRVQITPAAAGYDISGVFEVSGELNANGMRYNVSSDKKSITFEYYPAFGINSKAYHLGALRIIVSKNGTSEKKEFNYEIWGHSIVM